jgi:hypothetical protein
MTLHGLGRLDNKKYGYRQEALAQCMCHQLCGDMSPGRYVAQYLDTVLDAVVNLAPHSKMVAGVGSSNSGWTRQAQNPCDRVPGEMNIVEEFGVQSWVP